MIEFIISNFAAVVVFLVVLSILIVVHEWGHFITAKKSGIQVDEFSLGFGPRLWSMKKGGTDYMIKAFPLGGYVKMAGDERAACKGSPEEFFSQPVGKRALVVLNGPVINMVLAYVCLVAVFLLGYPGLSTRIQYVDPQGPSARAGLAVGDRILRIDGKTVYGWHNMEDRVVRSQGRMIDVVFERGDLVLTAAVEPVVVVKPDLIGFERKARDIGIDDISTVIGHVSKGFPAEAAGLREGDRVLKVNGQTVSRWEELHRAIAESPTEKILLTWSRDGRIMEKEVQAKLVKSKSRKGQAAMVKQIGIAPDQRMDSFRVGVYESFIFAWQKIVQITVLTYRSLYHMILGDISAKESMTGPIGIYYLITSAAAEGLSHLLFIMGMISASLAIFNLLPILPLDGGHLLLFAIEKVRGKPLPEKFEDFFMRFGLALILLLAVYVFYSDFSRFGWIDGILNLFRR